uniref:Pseudouridine synthase RsuA/RluA-like domain-containing protein n=1 Tax=Aegilops tauschii subsp. strangulata TaxID=200361 RepID=A0A453IBI3_AEGTS
TADAMAVAAAGETPPLQANYVFGRAWPDLNEGLSYTDTFRGADAETTASLINFYSENYKSSAPLPGWIHRIRNGQITVDGQVVTDPDMILREGSKLVYHRLAWKEPFAPHLLQVLYEDDDMVALNKPSGLQVLPKGIFQQRTVLAQLQWKEWKMPPSSCSKRKNVQLHPVPVHRLGRGTSGLLLCAKTKLAKVQLASYFAEGAANAEKKRDGTEVGKERKISKFYRALVTGILEHDGDVVTQPIGLVHYPGVAEGLYVACSSGKPAMSKVCVLERLAHQNQTLVQRLKFIQDGLTKSEYTLHTLDTLLLMILSIVLVGSLNFMTWNLLVRIFLLHMTEVMRGLYSLFPGTVGITCMLIGWSFLIQPRISDCVCGGKWPDVQQVTADLHEDM